MEEAPIGALGNEFLGAALEHPNLVQAQGVEAQGVLGAIRLPRRIGEILYARRDRLDTSVLVGTPNRVTTSVTPVRTEADLTSLPVRYTRLWGDPPDD